MRKSIYQKRVLILLCLVLFGSLLVIIYQKTDKSYFRQGLTEFNKGNIHSN